MKTKFDVTFDGVNYPCFYIDNAEQAAGVIAQLAGKPGILAADTETAGLPQYRHIQGAALSPHLASPRLLQCFTGTGAVVIDLWKTGKIDLKRIFETRPSVFHNMTFDYKMLRNHYDVKSPDMHCTCIMARCVWHALYPDDKRADLKTVTEMLFGSVINKQAGTSDWSMPNLSFEQVSYAAIDAIVQMRIFEKLDTYIDKLKLRKVYDLYRKAQIVLCEMELNGICLNKEQHLKNVGKWRNELIDAKEVVLKLTGMSRITDGELAEWLEKNLPEGLLALWPRTDNEKNPKLKTDANTFADFSHLDIVKPYAKFQKLKKLTTSFGMSLIHGLNPATGKLHPNYRVAGAKTGRLSCSEPNIQQMPKAADIRSAFIPSNGYEMVVADYSQVEVRCIAEFSNDPMMLKAFEDGLDIYSYTAAHLTGIPYESIGKKSVDRQQAKALVLGLNYGLGARKFAHYAKKGYNVDLSERESYQLVYAYKDLYLGLTEWQQQQVDNCIANKYRAYSAMGKIRKMYDDSYYGACMNHPIQGSCAEIMLLALVKAREALVGTSARLLASVHDEIVLECLPEDVSVVKKKLTDAMTEAYLMVLPSGRTVKNLVEPTSGANWAEAKQ